MNQKRRTRTAIKQAAAELVRAGRTFSMTEVAKAALVSKSTAYRYFPSQDALVAEVLLDAAVEPGLRELDAIAGHGTAAERVDAVIRADHALVLDNEAAFRTALRAMLVVRPEHPAVPRRPANRLRYLGIAVADLHDSMSDADRERLVAALALCAGIESVVVTKDVCGLDDETSESVKRWAASALLETACREASSPGH